jgi:hypothetical protein
MQPAAIPENTYRRFTQAGVMVEAEICPNEMD